MTIRIPIAAIALALAATTAAAGGAPERPSETWEVIRGELWPGAEVADGDSVIDIDAPVRAQDAAIVPVRISMNPQDDRRITEMTLIVEENPAPIAATFTFSDRMGR
ncbi:MAG: thiosulfate oxidation carrier protein SoxY, partial [Pseudomonadota bacterium]